jgi:molybdate transport system substrate-binding protein
MYIRGKVMNRILAFLSGVLLVFAAAGCGTSVKTPSAPSAATGAPSETTLTVLAASSLKESLDKIVEDYASAAPDIKITVTYSGSGALQTQIEQGAPADIFFSAGVRQMDALDKEGLIVPSSRVDLLQNEIVLIVPKDAPVTVGSFGDAASDAVGKIALGDPKSVPAGQYAQDTFTDLGLWDTVSAKATYGSDVKQVLSWVDSGNVDCGVVYKTDALSDSSVKVVAEAPYGSHGPIVYPVAAVKASIRQDAAAAFIKYLQSDASKTVFTNNGFSA